jgi:hypothetical protein
LTNAARLWREATAEHRPRLQRALFPEGRGCGTERLEPPKCAWPSRSYDRSKPTIQSWRPQRDRGLRTIPDTKMRTSCRSAGRYGRRRERLLGRPKMTDGRSRSPDRPVPERHGGSAGTWGASRVAGHWCGR